jgi:DNA processing protein
LASLAAGGCAIGVVADSLEKVSARPIWRQALLEGRLLLLSSEPPSARFQVWRAMGRNKLIYALADAALVVSSAKGEGGTWAGATEQLQGLNFCPVHVLSDPRGGPGLAALAEIGAHSWSEPTSAEAMRSLLLSTERLIPLGNPAEQIKQGSLLEVVSPEPTVSKHTLSYKTEQGSAPAPTSESLTLQVIHEASPVVKEPKQAPAVALATFVDRLLLDCIEEPVSIEELAVLLDVSKSEVKRWCQRLVEQGSARKLSKPVRYVRQKQS